MQTLEIWHHCGCANPKIDGQHTHTHIYTHSVGTILAVPASVITDWIIQGELLVWQAFLGVVFIIFGFCGFTFSEFIATRREPKENKEEIDDHSVMSQINSSFDDSFPLLIQSGSDRQLSWKRRIINNIYWI